ncbi:serine/threonine-protein kinase ATR [Daphnia magna]|uniref:serine/threonine-protein kinase ATR n=1 Tax=Daphnia magna TaxID=35525 RepID=UPI001E1BAE80|nr:serine/threonine-protein kinase ATR [Daphnia magna]XP_032793023.2 serine/threonine-protein kinase ATR [Daphnia magna]
MATVLLNDEAEQSRKLSMDVQDTKNTTLSAVSNHRKMMALPALKILADLDHSEKSFDVLMSVMDRCCREPNNQSVFLGCGDDELDHKLAFAYTKWFLGRFSIIFTRKSYMKAFNSFIELNVKILNLFRDKEPNQFRSLVNEFVNLLKELAVIVSQRSNEEVHTHQSFKLHSFVPKEPVALATDCLLKMDGLELNSLQECSLLQSNVTKIIAMSADGILQYDPQLCSKLVCILLDQLNYGEICTFKSTLNCLGQILVHDCSTRVLEIFLHYAYRLVNLMTDENNRVWNENSENSSSEIGVALIECLSRLSNPFGSCSMTNHQYLRLISFILLREQFHQPIVLNNLLQSMLGALQRFTCQETTSLCRFTPDLWIKLLKHSYAAIPPMLIILQSEMAPGDSPIEISEPLAKRLKIDFLPTLTSVTLWEQLKSRWTLILDQQVTDQPVEMADITALVRIAISGVKLKLKWREMNSVMDDADFENLNGKICQILLTGEINSENMDNVIAIICEYLTSCIPLTYAGIDKNIALAWFALSALPWLSSVSESCDLEVKWIQVSRKFRPSFLKHQSSFASCFVKFPVGFFKPWAVEIGLKIFDIEFLQADAGTLIPSLPWIVRHSKSFREAISQCLTTILASGSKEEIRELTKTGTDLVCALSGKTNVVNNPEDGLSLRCTHNLENLATSLKISIVPENMALFFLEFVFDENDHSVLHRVELFRSVLYHSARTEALRVSVTKKLHKAAQMSVEKNFAYLQSTVLKCTTILVQFWKETVMSDCFHVVFKILLLSSYGAPVMCWTSSTVKEIASKLNVTPEMLFQRHVTIVCDVLLSNPDLEWRNSLLSLAPEIFMSSSHMVSNVHQWLLLLIPTLIPRLVVERAKAPSPFFEEICNQMNKNPSELIVKYFSDIYVHILLYCDANEQSAVTSYVERITKLKLPLLRAPNFQSVHNDLVIQLHSQRDRVLKALKVFADEDKSAAVSTSTSTAKNRCQTKSLNSLGDYLRPRFLGILVHLDSVLLSKVLSDHIKIEALSSLSDLLHLMGTENIVAVRLKVLATLRTALQLTEEPFPQLNASAWDAFVRILGVQDLGPLVSQIAVSILPLHSSCAEQIRSILYYIVVENAETLKEHLKDLHFLPELPGLEDVVYSLKKTCSTNTSIPEQLSFLMRNISHEDFEVRMQSLSHLKSIVQKNFDIIQQLIMGTNDTSEAVLTRLISALLKGCSVREDELLLLYGKCFGYLGAVDPGRLTFSDQHNGDSTVYTATLIDDDFTFHLLGLLARSFLAPRNSQNLSILSFTIQQILKIYNSEDDSSKLFESALWNRLPEQLRVAFSPLTSSRYALKQQTESGPAPFPLYRSTAGKSYGNWLYNWTAGLIKKVTHPLAQQIFNACLPTVRRDLNINRYLLPYVVITALWSSPVEESARIGEEIMAVLTDRGLQRSPRRMMKRYSSSASATDVSSQGSSPKDSADANLHQSSMQGIFHLLDHLKKWLKQKSNSHRSNRKDRSITLDKEYKVVQELVDRIPNDLLARAAYQCQAYARAILHLEAHLKANPIQLRDQLGFLQKLYVAMDEPDGVAGVCAIRDQEPSLEENITAYEATGRLQDAFSCYERISQREDCSLEFYQGMLRCLLNLDLPQGSLTMANGLLQNCPEWRRNLDDYRAECGWRLGQWDLLEDVVKPYDLTSANNDAAVGWGVGLGQALLATKTNDLPKMEKCLRSVRLKQMRVISAINLERNSYPRAYENFVRLHILSEMESAVSLLDPALIAKETAFRARFSELLKNWNQRLDGVQASVRYTEPVLIVRRVVLKLIGQQVETKHPQLMEEIEAEIGNSWLVSARLARKAAHFQRAHILQLVASTSPCPPPAIYMEQAKLHWAKGEQDQAITVLKRGVEKRFPDLQAVQIEAAGLEPDKFTSDILECLKAKLLLARYYDETGHADMNTIIRYYKEVTEISKVWEEGFFRLAGYYDVLWNNLEGTKENHLDMARYIVTNLGRSMIYGSQFIYQAMPRMLSLWMELGTAEAENPKIYKNSSSRVKMTDVTRAIDVAQEKIPAYKFLTAFPQLISRICHPHPEVAALLRRIIAKTLVSHMQQCMWMMISVLKSSYSVRAKRCREIIDMVASNQPSVRKFFGDATNLADRLVELANKPVEDGVMVLSVEKAFRALPSLLSQSHFSKIMVPLQWLMTVTLPATPGENVEHNPFPKDSVYIVGVEDTVEVMHSLQKPKKISIRGSDGKLYVFLCKPQDDLRKDFRLMEFNQLINRYLLRDPDSRKRNLHIRTYGVIPLNEDCGLIEWIPNLIGLRLVLNRIYREKGCLMSNTELRKRTPHLRDTLLRKRELFEKEILPRYPSVFSEWFLSTFPDPQDWFLARLSYVRTTAVMSMVGFIVGLGDRHGENILFDAVCGDAVHVDFSCLFNKGLSFEWPEQVPFRLTHNMIEAMGATGVEGSFRKCCEVTLHVLRKEIDTLLSVLKPFVHDPLVEWSKKSVNKGRADLPEIKNEQALEHVENIKMRLQGYFQQPNSKNKMKYRLSVEGQVNQLIAEATNVDNLCQMYIGWAAYM